MTQFWKAESKKASDKWLTDWTKLHPQLGRPVAISFTCRPRAEGLAAQDPLEVEMKVGGGRGTGFKSV